MTPEQQMQAVFDAIDQYTKLLLAEVATRSKSNGEEIDRYNEHVIFGMKLANSMLLDSFAKVSQQTEKTNETKKRT